MVRVLEMQSQEDISRVAHTITKVDPFASAILQRLLAASAKHRPPFKDAIPFYATNYELRATYRLLH